MTPSALIQGALSDGVKLVLSPTGSIRATGERTTVNRWLPTIRAHKSELIAALHLSPLPEEIEQLIAHVMQLRDSPESDRQAFADDWRECPAGVERGLRHLADFYGKEKNV